MLPHPDRARAERVETKRSGRNLDEFIPQVYLILGRVRGKTSTCATLGFTVKISTHPITRN